MLKNVDHFSQEHVGAPYIKPVWLVSLGVRAGAALSSGASHRSTGLRSLRARGSPCNTSRRQFGASSFNSQFLLLLAAHGVIRQVRRVIRRLPTLELLLLNLLSSIVPAPDLPPIDRKALNPLRELRGLAELAFHLEPPHLRRHIVAVGDPQRQFPLPLLTLLARPLIASLFGCRRSPVRRTSESILFRG